MNWQQQNWSGLSGFVLPADSRMEAPKWCRLEAIDDAREKRTMGSRRQQKWTLESSNWNVAD
jgi:hypothetical protein